MKRAKVCVLCISVFCLMMVGCGAASGSGANNSTARQEAETVSQSETADITESAAIGGSLPSETTEQEVLQSEAADQDTVRPEAEVSGPGQTEGKAKVLAVYFSRMGNTEFPADVDAISSASLLVKDGELKGNAQMLAEWVADEEGCEVYEILTQDTYPADYRETTDVAKVEQNEDARPVLATQIEDFDQYETFYLVFPNWWGDMPQALYTFFDEYDFAGKRINVFVTHGGSSFSGTIKTMQSLEPDAEIVQGLSVRDSAVLEAESDVREWVRNNES